MLQTRYILAFLCLSAFPAAAATTSNPTDDVVARVNGRAILKSDLVREIDRARTDGRWVHDDNRAAKALDQALLQNLAADRAVTEKLDQDPVVAREIREVMAKHFLERRLREAGLVLNVSDEDVKKIYQTWPLIKIRHIAVFARNDEEKNAARERMKKIQKLLAGGERFALLADRYSEDPAAVPGGELEGRGVHNLPPALYEPAVRLSVGRVSTVIELDDAYHLVQLVEKKPYAEAPAIYLELLRSRLKMQRKDAFLSKVLDDLRPGSKIEIVKQAAQTLGKANGSAVPLIPEEKDR